MKEVIGFIKDISIKHGWAVHASDYVADYEITKGTTMIVVDFDKEDYDHVYTALLVDEDQQLDQELDLKSDNIVDLIEYLKGE